MTVESLRRGCVLIMKNVALAVWQGRVYGQSIRRRMGSVGTRISVLDLSSAASDASALGNIERLKQVKMWAATYIGPEVAPRKVDVTGNLPRRHLDMPPESQ
jgi:hypothetical protein